MRSHRDWPLLQIWSRGRRLHDWVKVENLRVARLEPMIVRGVASAILDLRFVKDDIGISVLSCLIDQKALDERTQDCIIWPFAVSQKSKDDDLAAIEAVLVPWLQAERAGLGFQRELIRRFHGGDQAFETARTMQLLGATSYDGMLKEFAGAHYAARFVPGKQIVVDRNLANIAALLAPSAARTAVIGCDTAEQSALQNWFGTDFLTEFSPARSAQIAIIAGNDLRVRDHMITDARIIDINGEMPGDAISLAPAQALEDLVRIGERGDGFITTKSSAVLRQVVLPLPEKPLATGGSHGRILFLTREDAFRAPGADTDEMYALQRVLQGEGFTVEITTRPDLYEPAQYDVVHAFGLLSADSTLAAFRRAEHAGVPTVLTAFFEDVAAGGWWGARASRSLLDLTSDEESSERVLSLLSNRLVYVDDVNANDRFDRGDESARRELLQIADIVITHSEAERAALETYANRKQLVALSLPLVYREHQHVSVSHLVPDQSFMFVHAPVEARHNVGLVLYAASALDIPCVFAGPILDRRLYRHISSRVNSNIVMVPEATAAEHAAMLSSAAVYIDAAWVGDGTTRIVKSLFHGVVPVLSDRRHLDQLFEEHVVRVDPASFDSLRNGMSEAWQRAGTERSLHAAQVAQTTYQAEAVFKATVSAYVAADAHRAQIVARENASV